ncbi:MAG: hypothetical protein H0T68_02810 [Gemmatimonadales bacterium]|nr:hypothetical protein [Gemmatimonadales bacterium]
MSPRWPRRCIAGFGTLRHLAPALHDRFDAGTASLADLDAVMDDYITAVEAESAAAAGWPDWINVPSKVGQVAAMKVFARAREPYAELVQHRRVLAWQ